MIKFSQKRSVLRANTESLKEIEGQQANVVSDFSKFVNDQTQFRTGDTGFSYRTINYLDSQGLLPDSRSEKKGWRRFSFKEMVFLMVCFELRQYGVSDVALKQISDIFFVDHSEAIEKAILLVFRQRKVMLILRGNEVFIADILNHKLSGLETSRSFIQLNLNELVMDVWGIMGQKKLDYVTESVMFNQILKDFEITPCEAMIVGLIRDKKYRSITIRRNDDSYLVSAEEPSCSKLSEIDLLDMVRNGDFSDISIIKRDGKVVNVTKKEVFKIQ